MDPLRVGVEVETNQLGKLAEGSRQVASDTSAMGASFGTASEAATALATKLMAQGLSAKEAQSALVNLGMSAKNSAAIMDQLTGATERTGRQVQVATSQVDAFTRQLANSAVRIAASEAGMGQLGFAFGRLGAMSTSLAPILAGAFTIVAIVAFIEMIERAITAYEKWTHLGEETVHKTDDLTLSLAHESDQLDVINIRLENQIAKLDHKPENFLGLALAENRVEADKLAKSLEDVIQKEVAILKAGPGLGSEIFLQKGNVAEVGKLLEPLERQMQLAILTNNQEEQKNILLQKQAILQKALTDEKGTYYKQEATHLAGVPEEAQLKSTEGFINKRGQAPDQDALNTYMSLLKATEIELGNIEKVKKGSDDRTTLAQAQTAAESRKNAEQDDKIYQENVKNGEKMAKADLVAIERRMKLEDEAQAKLNRDIKKNEEEEVKAAKQAEEAWQRAAEVHIRGEEEALRVSQRAAENRMRDIKAQESMAAAGINKGPVTNIIEMGAIQQQIGVAAGAMREASAAADDYRSQLEMVKDAMAAVNLNTEEGQREFKDLQTQMQQLQHMMDNANAASERWSTTLDQLKAHAKQLSTEMGLSFNNIHIAMLNSAQAGFQAFNSAFMQMLHGAKSFTQVLQSLWAGMVESFINALLRMVEEWVMQHLIMKAVAKLFGDPTTASEESIALKEIDRQAAIGDAAAEAAASVAYLGPGAAIAAAAVVEASLQALTSFAEGGVVKANLHEGEMVLPRNLSTFVQTAAASAGGMGGMGGPGGPGGPGGTGRGTVNHNRVNMEIHNHGGSMDEAQLAKRVTKELRRLNYT